MNICMHVCVCVCMYLCVYIACAKGHESTALVLLENGVNPNLKDKVILGRSMMSIMIMMIMIANDCRGDFDSETRYVSTHYSPQLYFCC